MNGTAMNNGIMADGDIATDLGGIFLIGTMNYGAILHVHAEDSNQTGGTRKEVLARGQTDGSEGNPLFGPSRPQAGNVAGRAGRRAVRARVGDGRRVP